jgi:hypothetical protein
MGNDNKFFGQFAGSSAYTPPTSYNNIVFTHIASSSYSPITNVENGGNQITYVIEIPPLDVLGSGFFLYELTSSFFKYLLVQAVNIKLYIGTSSGTLGESDLIANGHNILTANDIGAINRTFYNGDDYTLFGLSAVGLKTGEAQSTDYADGIVSGNNTISQYVIDNTITQFLQFVVKINDSPIPVGAFARLDWCKLNIYDVSH